MKKLFTFLVVAVMAVFSVNAQVNEDFESVTAYETLSLDGWINHNEAGSVVCLGHEYNEAHFAYFNTYKSGDDSNIMWLITPKVNLDEFENDSIKFELAYGYFQQSDPIAIKYSLDFSGNKEDIASATWVDITDECVIPTADDVDGSFTPFMKTSINIDDLAGDIYVAFVYTGSGTNTTAVELDNVIVGNPKPQSRITSLTVASQLLTSDIDLESTSISLTVYPGTDVTALSPDMELSEGATVSPAIGSVQDFTSPVIYTVTSSDAESVTAWTVTINILSDVPVSIYDLQYVVDPTTDDASAYVGEPVFTTGIVTYGSGSGSAYVQSAQGEWNGVYVYVSSSADISLTKGDSVLMFGTIKEYYNLTEFIADSVYTVSDRKSVDAVTVTAPLGESVEGVLVKVESLAIVANGEESYFGVTASNDTVLVEKDLYSGLSLTEGSSYNLTGIVTYSYDEYRLYPRSSSDVEVGTSSAVFNESELSVYPNPASDILYIEGANAEKVKIINIVGSVVGNFVISDNSVDVSSLDKGIYMLSVDSKVIRFVKQ